MSDVAQGNGNTMEDQVKDYIENVRPYIQSHGGDVEFVSLKGMTVRLKLLGSCHTCPHALATLHQGIEAQLRELVNPDIVVERAD
ncbi:MAG TPA: NifU family protein [Kiritimatiellia bacterium]|nr:NifU family protein [Kiritimatiellia bacterium]